MPDVNSAEVSAILKKQLEGHLNVSSMNEVGTVLEVGDGIEIGRASCRERV